MKSYTDINQSKKLAEILPIESADMHYARIEDDDEMRDWTVYLSPFPKICSLYVENLPCWSLAALLDVLPSSTLDSSDDHHYRLHCMERFTEWHDNPIDACYEMIMKLKEKNLL